MSSRRSDWTIPQITTRGFGAALFDLDGVLTPTTNAHMSAWRRMFTHYFDSHGVAPAYSDDDYFSYIDGKPRYDGVRACLASRGISLPEGQPDDLPGERSVCALGNAKNDAFNAVLNDEGVAPYPGSVVLMDHLDGLGVPMAVVSSSRNAADVLEVAGIAHRFAVVVDGAVASRNGLRGKPAPDTYRYAAHLLGVDAGEAVVIEDALSGVEAGAAGDFGLVIGVDRGAGAEALTLHGAAVVVSDLEELVQR